MKALLNPVGPLIQPAVENMTSQQQVGGGGGEGSVGGRSHHQHYHLTQLSGCLYLTDNQGDFDHGTQPRQQRIGIRPGRITGGTTIKLTVAPRNSSTSSAPRRSPAGRPHKTAVCPPPYKLGLRWQGVKGLWTVLKQARLHLERLRPLQSKSSP